MEQANFIEKSTHLLDFALARNDFLNAFAEVEARVCKILASCGHKSTSEPFGNRLKAFRSADKTNLIANKNLRQRDQIADAIALVLPARADVVHSNMRVATLDGESVAIFTNAQDVDAILPQSRIISLSQLRRLSAELRNLNKRIDELRRVVSPASSPPPPSPGAADDP